MRPQTTPVLTTLALAALAALPLVAFGLPARADAPLPLAAIPQITVTGEGQVEAAPDLATLTLGVTTEGVTAAEALSANSAALATVIANLRAAGIEGRDIQTSGLSLNPVWSNYSGDRPQRIDRYQAVNGVTVRVRALDGLGTVLDAAVKDGANTLNGLAFGMAEPGPLMDEARNRAVADARRRAELLAAAAGVRLGRVLTIGEGGGGGMPAPMFRADAALASPVPVEQGEVAIRASVTVVWELLP
ncbi:MAG: SIMPL domain-containing protein [Paracoccaceae bacterium]|nr:MAG: SIMPL domain-containing protein [Paracoccaceae bacterium]